MLRQIKRKIFLIVDGHPVHRSVKLRNWLKKNSNRIRVFFLPAYSPELNPDEIF
ncbi:MAG: transposase [Candidatus Scalinduaceae bacterium]